MIKNFCFLPLFIFFFHSSIALNVVRERPEEWNNLVCGGQFKDLFLPMPEREGYTSDTWGGANVKPRDVTNGIEDPEYSYWGGYPLCDKNGLYHLYTARWREDHPDGHFAYLSSEIVHATAADPMGPYTYQDTIGWGHNPEVYQTKSGDYMLYCTHGFHYTTKNLGEKWKLKAYNYNKRERWAFPGYVNFSFAPREDGSVIAVSRRGYIWVSPDGGPDMCEVTADSVYPKVPGVFEDPVM